MYVWSDKSRYYARLLWFSLHGCFFLRETLTQHGNQSVNEFRRKRVGSFMCFKGGRKQIKRPIWRFFFWAHKVNCRFLANLTRYKKNNGFKMPNIFFSGAVTTTVSSFKIMLDDWCSFKSSKYCLIHISSSLSRTHKQTIKRDKKGTVEQCK